MFKPVHGIRGNLIAGISSFATALSVDDDTLCLLRRRLTNGDHTYMLVRASYDYEIVKVVGFTSTGITVIRAQDGTTAQAFLAGAELEFVLSEGAIAEVIADKALGEINLTGGGMVTVVQTGVNAYTISAPEINITSVSANILVGGEFPNFVLSAPLIIDCCD